MSFENAKDLLEEKYPLCFVELHASPKPLKKGIRNDVLALIAEYPDILTKKGIQKYLSSYVNRPSYFKCVKVGAKRIDLEGDEVSEVTEAEYKFTQERYEERLKVWQQRHKNKKMADKPKKDVVVPIADVDKKVPEDKPKRKTLTLKKKAG